MGGGAAPRPAAKAAVLGGYSYAAVSRSRPQPPPPIATDLDDWVLAGDKDEVVEAEELLATPRTPEPRQVFGPVPTMEEAKAATSDLKDAVATVYFSPAVTESQKRFTESIAHPDLANSTIPEPKDDSIENLVVPSGPPGHVIQAFSLLHESPEAQDVVASLACDKKVWDAVMKNEKVMEFFKTYETKLTEDPISCAAEEVVGAGAMEILQTNAEQESLPHTEEPFKDYMQKMKVLLSEMVSNLSNVFQDFVGGTAENQSSTMLKTGTASSSHDFATGASFVLLAIASMLVILLNRA